MIKVKAWRWPVWPKHVAWYNYQKNKGVLTEWFYTKLSPIVFLPSFVKIGCLLSKFTCPGLELRRVEEDTIAESLETEDQGTRFFRNVYRWLPVEVV